METILVFDTETTSIEKPFAYDVGYKIFDRDFNEIASKHFVIEQIWHNLPLFESAYYHDKRPLYVLAMRKHEAIMTKWGYMVSEMIRDIQKHNVVSAYAFNSSFDDKVFTFCCNWFKTRNRFDSVPIYDIWGYSSQFITNTAEYRNFCELHQLFTESGKYQGNAEALTKFLTADPDFEEAHRGLQDVEIEAEILLACLDLGAEIGKEYKVVSFLWRNNEKPLVIKVDNQVVYSGVYRKKYVREGLYSFKTEV
jgi:hypothetical protein